MKRANSLFLLVLILLSIIVINIFISKSKHILAEDNQVEQTPYIEINWYFEEYVIDDVPYSDVYLHLDGEIKEKVKIGTFIGNFNDITDWELREIPEGTLLYSQSWYAGGGDDLCLIWDEEKGLSIMWRPIHEIREDDYEQPDYKRVFNLEIPSDIKLSSSFSKRAKVHVSELVSKVEASVYNTYGRKILFATNSDMNRNGMKEVITLEWDPYDQGIYLKINNDEICLRKEVYEEQVLGHVTSDAYEYDVKVAGSKILVGLTYAHVNKYGSKAWLECFSYTHEGFLSVWNSQDLVSKPIRVDNINLEKKVLSFTFENKTFIRHLSDEDIDYLKFRIDRDEITPEGIIETVIIPSYTIEESDQDGDSVRIITPLYIWSGAGPIADTCNLEYSFSDDGMTLDMAWLRSNYPE